MICEKGHEMVVRDCFKLDHETDDTPRDTENLRWLEERGLELGAAATLWYCEACDFAQVEFDYGELESKRPADEDRAGGRNTLTRHASGDLGDLGS